MELIRKGKPNILAHPVTSAISIAQAQRGPSLSVIRSTQGTDQTVAMICVLLREAIGHFNHSVGAEHLVGYARRIIVDYYWWRMEDLALCLSRGIQGVYGHSVARWTYGDTFLTWAEGYEKERVEHHIQSNVNKKHEDQRGLEINGSIFTEETKKVFEKKIETQVIVNRKRNKADEFLEEFDKLWREQNPTGKGMRFVEYRGKKVDVAEFMQMKFDGA